MISFPPILSITLSDLNRFWSKVEKTELCWNWIGQIGKGALSSTGLSNDCEYGRFKFKQQSYVAHRVAYFLHYRVDPGEQLVCHECNNPQCVRPDHLFLGTQSDNMKHRIDTGKIQRGVLHPRCIFHESDVLLIRQRYVNGESDWKIAQSLGVSQGAITAIVKRQTWKHLP